MLLRRPCCALLILAVWGCSEQLLRATAAPHGCMC